MQQHALQPQHPFQASHAQMLAPSAPLPQLPGHSQLQYLSTQSQLPAHATRAMQIPQPTTLPFRSLGESTPGQVTAPQSHAPGCDTALIYTHLVC